MSLQKLPNGFITVRDGMKTSTVYLILSQMTMIRMNGVCMPFIYVGNELPVYHLVIYDLLV